MITSKTESLWKRYVDAEHDRIRSVSLPALNDFVEAILSESEVDRDGWALQLAESVADHDDSFPIRFPLFRSVLLPSLMLGDLSQRPGCARWLAHFGPLLYHSKDHLAALPASLRTPEGLLREALRIDGPDTKARAALVQIHESFLDYSVHEVPAGVLFGSNAATSSECIELIELLHSFRRDVHILGQEEKYEDLILECEFHFTAYREYLLSGCPGGSYERFLSTQRKGA